MKLIEDTNNKVGKHNVKNYWWGAQGIEVVRYRLPVADYVLMNDKIQDVIDRKAKRGIPVKMMDFLGTYNIAVDVKNSIGELSVDLTSDHERFRDELILAQNNNIKLYIVVENDFQTIKANIFNTPVREIKDLFRWKNPRAFIFQGGKQKYPHCAKGAWIAKCCMTIEKKYGCKFVFCTPLESAKVITEILEGKYQERGEDLSQSGECLPKQ